MCPGDNIPQGVDSHPESIEIFPTDSVKKLVSLLRQCKRWMDTQSPTASGTLPIPAPGEEFLTQLIIEQEFYLNNPRKREAVFTLSDAEIVRGGNADREQAWVYFDEIVKKIKTGKLDPNYWNGYIESFYKGLPDNISSVLDDTSKQDLLFPKIETPAPTSPTASDFEPTPSPIALSASQHTFIRSPVKRTGTEARLDERIYGRADNIARAKGMILGEDHLDYAAYAYLNSQLEQLKVDGITHLCMEFFKDTDAELLNDYFNSDSSELPRALLNRIAVKDVMMSLSFEEGDDYDAFGREQRKYYEDHIDKRLPDKSEIPDDAEILQYMINNPDGLCSLIKKAKTLGIPIVPIDKAEYGILGLSDRVEKMNTYAATQIASLATSSFTVKPLILVGALHATDCLIGEKEHTGLSKLLGIPAVSISSASSTFYSSITAKPQCSGEVAWREPAAHRLGVNTDPARSHVRIELDKRLEERAEMSASMF